MPLHRRGRLFAYGVYSLSVLRFVAQVAPLPQTALTAEQGAIAQLFRCPMHALGPGLLPLLGCVGGDAALPDLRRVAEATALRFAATHASIVAEVDARIAEISNRNDALLAPLHREWRNAKVLSCVRAAVARHAELQRAAGHDLTTQGHL